MIDSLPIHVFIYTYAEMSVGLKKDTSIASVGAGPKDKVAEMGVELKNKLCIRCRCVMAPGVYLVQCRVSKCVPKSITSAVWV